jgi:hypothetical protein
MTAMPERIAFPASQGRNLAARLDRPAGQPPPPAILARCTVPIVPPPPYGFAFFALFSEVFAFLAFFMKAGIAT